MATFTTQVFQNEYLPHGGTDVHAIVRMTVENAGRAGATGRPPGEILIVDTSGSMGQMNMRAARDAAQAAMDCIPDGTFFAVIAGTHEAFLAYPMVQSGPGMVQMNPRTRAEAKQAISWFKADGGTAIGAWLQLARALFLSMGGMLGNKHALLLTDGENRDETSAQLTSAIEACQGLFQCDCRGIGTDWIVEEVRRISSALLGSLDIIPFPDDLAPELTRIFTASAIRGVHDAQLHVWIPQGAQMLFLKQVSPTLEDLTMRARPVTPLTGAIPTGAWSDEERDYHVAVRLPAKNVGQEQLAARIQLVVDGDIVTQGLVKAIWSDDAGLAAGLDPQVAHYTGQAELADAIQSGLEAKASGDVATATVRLGKAIKLAEDSGNSEATRKLRQVLDVEADGTVRLKKHVSKAADMALDTASTKTTRIKG